MITNVLTETILAILHLRRYQLLIRKCYCILKSTQRKSNSQTFIALKYHRLWVQTRLASWDMEVHYERGWESVELELEQNTSNSQFLAQYAIAISGRWEFVMGRRLQGESSDCSDCPSSECRKATR